MAAAPPPSIYTESFNTSSNNNIQNEVNDNDRDTILSGFSFDEYFLVNESISVIKENNFKQIALQLPDYLLWASSELSNKIQKSVPQEYGIKVFILGDTSYGSCCVDEVTSSHLKADFIIHYGHSCLSPEILAEQFKNNENIKVSNINTFNNIYLTKSFKNNNNNNNSISNENCGVSDCCSSNNNNNDGCCGNTKNNDSSCCNSNSNSCKNNNNNNNINNNNIDNNEKNNLISGRIVDLNENDDIKNYSFVWIGDESLTLTNILLNFNQQSIYRYYIDNNKIAQETLPRNKSLMRRYHISEKCKDASVIGIVVSTLSVAKYSETIDGLKKLIISSGKKPYVFVVGRLNVPKLANFSEIDIYVIVACSENTMVDSKDFYKPIATPFELNLALRNEQWTGEYVTDFGKVFPKLLEEKLESTREKPEDEVEDDEGNIHHFSLVTGRIVLQNKSTQQQEQQSTSGEIVSVDNSFKQISLVENHLQNKTYKGLDMRIGETPVTAAIEGLSGIPKNYTSEKNNLNK
ncbi:hypothetical protein DICPUDRAFT_155754 [Dictyostelium purpureum]|uniref:2-(3-amino-3-carboxypropyl)histidine synthase subunit 2 n=1 Tax=Dictyostelium purpureum TaxID=5786 RepID=F0ZUT2_DICPU|nr:uncharacterized protein DICPUDRAFT_155754 [Dictyostelium purpureum]EGC32302.1 hypothetical protein DICPUDRAFT_155754 [Dictyostelium purpureum]|eukprot:XP_003291180.1 hypothetical protein DICPUDRAFT_155754 [Dictyostelium purpureum]